MRFTTFILSGLPRVERQTEPSVDSAQSTSGRVRKLSFVISVVMVGESSDIRATFLYHFMGMRLACVVRERQLRCPTLSFCLL